MKTSSIKQIPKVDQNSVTFHKIKWGIFLTGISVFGQLYLFQPLLPELARYYRITPATSSLLVSAGTMGIAVGLFIFAFIADIMTRKKLMSISIILASILTMISIFSINFYMLVVINFLKGMLLSGVAAVVIPYLAEEVNSSALSVALALYISGNTLGGMMGRVISILLSSQLGWHLSVLIIGSICFIFGIVFIFIFPESVHFMPQPIQIQKKLKFMKVFLKDRFLQVIFAIAFVIMGSFISVYNYLGFRLESEPFYLSTAVIAYVYFMYIFGIGGSLFAGKWASRFSAKKTIWLMQLMLIIGLIFTLFSNLWCLIIGVILVTAFFFATYTLASRLLSKRAVEGKSMASCLFFLFYYIGSSVIGSGSGSILSSFSWLGLICSLIVLNIGILFLTIWIAYHKPKNLHLLILK